MRGSKTLSISRNSIFKAVFFALIFTTFFFAEAEAQTEENWLQQSPQNSPCARKQHAMAFDEGRGEVVLFGGKNSSGQELGDTWVWDGVNWEQKFPATSPPAMHSAAMAYDKKRGYVILLGAANLQSQTWLWDGTNWEERTTTAIKRRHHAMVYDEVEEKVYAVGGYSGVLYLNIRQYWNGSGWVNSNFSGDCDRLADSACAFDPTREYMGIQGAKIEYGGAGDNPNTPPPGRWVSAFHTELWGEEYGLPVVLHEPVELDERRSHTMAYYPPSDKMIVFGGVDVDGVYHSETFHLRHINVVYLNPADNPGARA